jgi:hypothetical protein
MPGRNLLLFARANGVHSVAANSRLKMASFVYMQNNPAEATTLSSWHKNWVDVSRQDIKL